LIGQLHCRGGPHDAANGGRDLNQTSRVCVVFFEKLGGSVMMAGGLIGMTHCGGGVLQAGTRCGHVSSGHPMLLAASWAKKEHFSPADLDGGRLGNYSGAEIGILHRVVPPTAVVLLAAAS
jgi:hypothetical protein